MGTYSKLDGTTKSLFEIDPTSNTGHASLQNVAGTLEVRNSDNSGYAALRVLDDAGDNQSAMTRGEIEALAGGEAGTNWFRVAFAHGDSGGNAQSTSLMPAGSYIVAARVLVINPYDNGPNVMTIGWTAPGSNDISDGSGINLQQNGLYDLPQVGGPAGGGGGGPYHIEVGVSGGSPTTGDGEVWVGYVVTPKT